MGEASGEQGAAFGGEDLVMATEAQHRVQLKCSGCGKWGTYGSDKSEVAALVCATTYDGWEVVGYRTSMAKGPGIKPMEWHTIWRCPDCRFREANGIPGDVGRGEETVG